MDARGMAARASALLAAAVSCATLSCAPQGTEDEGAATALEPELALDLSVDRVDISHGALRVTATMVDGAADLSVRLADGCGGREVGGGISTLSTIVWTFGAADLADMLGCDLVVRARVRSERGYVTKAATLSVGVDTSVAGEPESEPPQAIEYGLSTEAVSITFRPVKPGAKLSAGDSLIEPAPIDGEERPGDARTFDIPCGDFARSLILRRPLMLDGVPFDTSLSVGGTALEPDPTSPEPTED